MTGPAHEGKKLFELPTPLVTLFAFLLLILSGSCEEQLPEYRDPRNALEESITGRYVLGISDNSMKIEVMVVNVYDETFEGKAVLQGSGSILLKRNQATAKTFTLTPANVSNGKYNTATGILRMDPNDTLRLVFSWNFVADGGVDLRQTVFQYYPDPTCTFDQPVVIMRRIAFQETFIIRATLRVFDKIADLSGGPYEFTLCHVDQWVPGNSCPPIIFDENYCPASIP